jgi:hypothetical protein
MDELFKKTNEFLVEFYETLNKEFEDSMVPTGSPDEYDFEGELNYVFEELWEKESKYYLFGAGHQYQNTRNYELKELNDKGVYFHLCKFKVYEKTYKERLNKFQEIYEDAEEISFLEDELKGYSNPIGLKEPFKYLELKQKKDLTFKRKRTVDFLVKQAKTTGYNIIVSGDESDGALSYVKEKIKNIAHSPLLESNSTINETNPPKNLDYLKIGALIAQEDIKNPDVVEKELHNNIFKYNAFETFEKYFENKKITQHSRTDLRVIFDLLKEDDLLFETVELKHYIKWLNSQFDYDISELKKLDLNTRPNIQRANDYKDYKKTTLKKP